MKIEVKTSEHLNREYATLTINGKSIDLPKDVEHTEDDVAIAFFTGYAIAMADLKTSLSQIHHHDQDNH